MVVKQVPGYKHGIIERAVKGAVNEIVEVVGSVIPSNTMADQCDPMGLAPKQPNIEFFSTECYSGPKQFDKFPGDSQRAFNIIAELFTPKSQDTITLCSANPTDAPIVNYCHAFWLYRA